MLEKKVLETIKEYNLIKDNEKIIVAVSGGPDSMCLLSILMQLKEKLKIKEIIVAHVNHMLRKEADEETKYVQRYCESNNIKCFIKYINIKEISEHNKIGEELAGREERYKFFEEVFNKVKADKIAIAHNYNDNAETVLMHFLRGSGTTGLIGIRPSRQDKIIRPIIKCKREEIEDYCKKNNINPKYDKSNENNIYTRNKIRNELIPYIQKEYNPNIIETINRLAQVISEEEEYIINITIKEYEKIILREEKNKIILDLKKFNIIENTIKSRIIIYIVKDIFKNKKGIEKIHINDIIKLCQNNIGNKFLTPNKHIRVFVKAGEITFEKIDEIF